MAMECRKSRYTGLLGDQLVSVPAAWGSVRGLRLGNLTSDPPESETACKGGWRRLQGQRKVEGEGDGGLCHLQYKSSGIPSRSAGLLFFCLIPKAIRQFSWETAAKIYICLSVSTYQLSPDCVPPLVDSIFKSSVSISV